jgi:hypothetical protein
MGTFEFFYRIIVAVVGYDAEAADYSNPRGEVYGDVFQVIAERPDGTRYIVALDTSDEAQAKRQVAKLTARGEVPMEHLYETDPAYGSRAYQGLDATGFFRQREIQEDKEAYEGYR